MVSMLVEPDNSTPQRAAPGRGLTVTETMVCIGILALLVGVSAALISGGRRGRALAGCAANLHNLHTAFQMYLTDYQDTYPEASPIKQWEDQLRAYAPRAMFRCPADAELFTVLGSSYNWRDTGDPATTLAGVPASRVFRSDAVLVFDAFPGWHAPGKIQVLKVDNTQELMPQEAFFSDLQRSPLSR
jgi:hypothetical protein